MSTSKTRESQSRNIWGLQKVLKLSVALLVLLPAAAFAQSSDDSDPGLGGLPSAATQGSGAATQKMETQTVYRMQGRNVVPVTIQVPVNSNSAESGVFETPSKPKKFKAHVFATDLAPVPAIPERPKKFNSGPVSRDNSVDNGAPLPPPAPVKFRSKVAASGVNGANGAPGANGTDDSVQPLPAPAPPAKFKSRVNAGSVGAPAPIAAPPVSPKMRARVDAGHVTTPDDNSPAPLPAPPVPVKFHARASDENSNLPAPPVPKKLKALVDSKYVTDPADPVSMPVPAPAISPKFKAAAVMAAQSEPITPTLSAPQVPLSKDAVNPAPTSCPSPIAANSVDQANELKTTLNQTLITKVKDSVQDVWDDGDDAVDAHQLMIVGAHDQPPSKLNLKGSVSPFVKKLLVAARFEAGALCRWVEERGHVVRKCHTGSKHACLQGVRMAIEKSLGIPNKLWPGKHGRSWAKEAGPYLKKEGFQLSANGQYTPRNAPVGSVLIYDVPGSPNQAGHIEIKGQDGYYSDFYEKRPISEAMPGRRRLIEIWVPPTTASDRKS